jgi:hypothetical protein
MLGIVLTILAVFAVVCVAFYFSDSAESRAHGMDALFLDHGVKVKDPPVSLPRK